VFSAGAWAHEAVYSGEIVLQTGVEDVLLTAPPRSAQLPAAWDWRSTGMLTTDLNQHIPTYCGSCWAHASMSTIADRIKILTGGKQRDVIPSIQVLLNCGTAGSCGGGDVNAAFRWVHQNTIPDVTCQQYTATDGNCSAITTCMNCEPQTGCYAVENYPKISISEYGRVIGDDNIMQEIYNRGPVACYINANCIENITSTSGVNMYDKDYNGNDCKPYLFNHAIQLNGWGTDENGVDYWIGRNSWGTYYGEYGFFRVVRGGAYNPIGCYFAVPDVPNF